MKVTFEVHGTDEASLRAAAKPVLSKFVEGTSEGWTYDIDAEALTSSDGKITGWKGVVTAMKAE